MAGRDDDASGGVGGVHSGDARGRRDDCSDSDQPPLAAHRRSERMPGLSRLADAAAF
ncbi:hypothetical protein SEVIR_2G235701v4 [Setaria viridis]